MNGKDRKSWGDSAGNLATGGLVEDSSELEH
jgi:hypothetical protein